MTVVRVVFHLLAEKVRGFKKLEDGWHAQRIWHSTSHRIWIWEMGVKGGEAGQMYIIPGIGGSSYVEYALTRFTFGRAESSAARQCQHS